MSLTQDGASLPNEVLMDIICFLSSSDTKEMREGGSGSTIQCIATYNHERRIEMMIRTMTLSTLMQTLVTKVPEKYSRVAAWMQTDVESAHQTFQEANDTIERVGQLDDQASAQQFDEAQQVKSEEANKIRRHINLLFEWIGEANDDDNKELNKAWVEVAKNLV